MDRPFSETEKVNLLAEVLKASAVPPGALLNVIYDYRIEPPQWLEVSRPPGRSSADCQKAFQEMCSQHPRATVTPRPAAAPTPTASHPSPHNPPLSVNAPTSFTPRQYIPPPESSGTGRSIQPRPAGVSGVSTMPTVSSFPTSGVENTSGGKKRGRPSNAELEARKQEYEARGEPYPPPRSKKRAKPASNIPAPSQSASVEQRSRVPSTESSSSPGTAPEATLQGSRDTRALHPPAAAITSAPRGYAPLGIMEPPPTSSPSQMRPPSQTHHPMSERGYPTTISRSTSTSREYPSLPPPSSLSESRSPTTPHLPPHSASRPHSSSRFSVESPSAAGTAQQPQERGSPMEH